MSNGLFCGVCGYTQSSGESDESGANPTISCSRCHIVAHVSCLRLTRKEMLPSRVSVGSCWTCSCCSAKIEECGLSRKSTMFSKKVDPRLYSCLFCNVSALRKCLKAEQLHLTRIQCGLWAHSLCHLLGNDIRHDATDLQTCPIDVQDDGEDITSCENWDVDMVVKFCFGNYMGRHAVIISRPTSDGYVRVRTMGSSADDSEEAIDADCTDLQLAQPRKRDCVKVLTGPFKDHIGNVKMVLEETEVVLDNLPPVDIIPLRHVAWIHRSAGESNATNGSVDSATHIIRPEVIGRMRKLECFFCNTTGDGLVLCGEMGCMVCFHMPCALTDKRCTVQVTTSASFPNNSNESCGNNIQFILHCPDHKKEFDPSNGKVFQELLSIDNAEDTRGTNSINTEEEISSSTALANVSLKEDMPAAHETFAPGMDAGECTVVVRCLGDDWGNGTDVSCHLNEDEVRKLFLPCGKIFKIERGSEQNVHFVYFTEKKFAMRAVSKYRDYVNTPESRNALKKYFHLRATQLGAEVFVRGLDPSVTEVKLRRAFPDCKSVSLLSDRSIAFIKFLKVRSAKKAIHDLNKVAVEGVSRRKGVLTVEMTNGKNRNSLTSLPADPDTAPTWCIDRTGGNMSPSSSSTTAPALDRKKVSSIPFGVAPINLTSRHNVNKRQRVDVSDTSSHFFHQTSQSTRSAVLISQSGHDHHQDHQQSSQATVKTLSSSGPIALSQRSGIKPRETSLLSLKAMRSQKQVNYKNKNSKHIVSKSHPGLTAIDNNTPRKNFSVTATSVPRPASTSQSLTSCVHGDGNNEITFAPIPEKVNDNGDHDDGFKKATSRDPRRKKN